MTRISAIFVFLGVMGTVLTDMLPANLIELSDKANAIICKEQNLNNDKWDKWREEVKACKLDECADQADDLPALKSEYVAEAVNKCSAKYKKCLEEKRGQYLTKGFTQEDKKAFQDKWALKKDCLNSAFEKVFGEKI